LPAAFPLGTREEENYRSAAGHHHTTLDKLAKAVESGKYRLADIPGQLFEQIKV